MLLCAELLGIAIQGGFNKTLPAFLLQCVLPLGSIESKACDFQPDFVRPYAGSIQLEIFIGRAPLES